MPKFLKENLVLVTGIVLPILLVIGFLILAQLPKAMLTPPKHDFLLVGYRHDNNHIRNYYLSFDVKDGMVRGKATPRNKEHDTYYYRQHATLFLYDAENHSFEEVVYDLPDGVDELEKTVTFSIEELSGKTFSKKQTSPDGYRFEYLGYRGRGGLLGEMFGMGRRHDSHYVLTKDRAHFELPTPAHKPYYYYGQNLSFRGVISEGQ